MATTFRPKVWIGLTATLATGALALAVETSGAEPTTGGASFQIAAGPEGGESGGEHGHEHADPLAGASEAESLEVRLILMKGHLDVGHELYLAGLARDATPHISHPSTELYGHVEPELKAHNIPAFHDKLEALRLAFEARAKGKKFEHPYAAAVGAIDRALATVNRDEAPAPARLASIILNVAAGEYSEAFEGGDGDKITAAVEYQDALGFYRRARALIEANAPAFKHRDAGAYAKVVAHLNVLKTTWPSAAVPEESVLTDSRFQMEVEALTKLLKTFE